MTGCSRRFSDWGRSAPRLELMQRARNGRSAPSPGAPAGTHNGAEPTQRARQRAFCIAALPEGEDLQELGELLRTAGVAVAGEMVQRREQPHPNTYLGPGKVAEAKAAAKACDANVIACDDELSARQERNLEEALGLPVVDRTTVILDIFASHAGSAAMQNARWRARCVGSAPL